MKPLPPDLGDATLALAAVAVDTARIPLSVAARFPGVRLLARDGAFVRARVRSHAEGIVGRVLAAPETARALDRALAGALPDIIMRSALEHHVLERMAAQIDVDAIAESEPVQRLVRAIRSRPVEVRT